MSSVFDIVVVGGGPGGYVAAIRASQLGMKVALVERAQLGGVCLNWGCIPTKALLRTAEIYQTLQHLEDFGLKAEKISFDMKKIVMRSRAVASQLSSGIKHLMKKNKVTVIEGEAKLTDKKGLTHQLSVGDQVLEAKNVILATGAQARTLPGLEPDGQAIWTYREAMVPETLPKSLVVVGSGAIGIEFASFYRTFGTEVTVIEVQDRILPVEDVEISAFTQKALEKRGIKFHTKTTVNSLKTGKEGVTVELQGTSLKVERVILAIGIVGNTEGLGLEKTKAKVDKGHIVTNALCATDEPGLFAIGDVTGGPWLAHKASHEAVICVEAIAGQKPHALNKKNIPGWTYSSPQVASVGLTEAQAIEAGHKIRVGRFPYMANGKAVALGETEGLVKTIFDEKTGEFLGAHMVGTEVTEMIQGFCIARTLEATEADLMQTVFPHPTLSEMMHESVLDAYGRALHF